MNESSPKPRLWRLQFSLRTFLIGSMLASLGIWWGASWYRRPGPEATKLPGGLVIWEEQHVEKADARGQVLTYAKGRYVITDEHGRVWCRGRLDEEGRATGRWNWYYASGGLALSGECAEGFRRGSWAAWNERRDQTLEVQHSTPRDANPKGHYWKKSPFMSSSRSGPATLWHASGRPSEAGSYEHDRREGAWTCWNERGERTAEGAYRQGLRHGPWTMFEPPGSEPRVTYYVNGVEVPDLPAKIAALAKKLDSADWEARADAIEALGVIGAEALPVLTKALSHRDEEVVARALRALAALGPEASGALEEVRRLSQDKNTEALLTLFAIDEAARDEMLPKLLALADLEDDEACREWHMRIAQLGEPALVPLASTLDSADATERLAALDVLASMIWPSFDYDWQFPLRPDYRGQLLKIFEQAQDNSDPVISNVAKKVLEYLKTRGPYPPWRNPGRSRGAICGSIIPVVG